jgi:serine/threonine-protein kinase RsbW
MRESHTSMQPVDLALAVSITGLADADTLARCLDAAEHIRDSHGLAEADAYAVRLAVDEACTNLVEHAYAGRTPEYMALEIWVAVDPPLKGGPPRSSVYPEEIHIYVRDKAPPFDPCSVAVPDLDVPLEERRIGGLGWFFIREMMAIVEYKTLPNGINQLKMVRFSHENDAVVAT